MRYFLTRLNFLQIVIILMFCGCKSGYGQDSKVGNDSSSWILNSFADFVQGTFDDSGVNAYVAADGSLRLINQWDLTGDGYLDIFLPNTHGENERTELFVYSGENNWNPRKRIELPSDGGQAAAVADLNGDGRQDLVVANRFNGTRTDLDLWIYWGDKKGFSAENRTSLPAQGAEAVALGDLNNDGYPEIVIANSGVSYHVSIDSFKKSFVYWNHKGTFLSNDRTELPTEYAKDVLLVDLDHDGLLEIVFAYEGNDPGEGGLRIFQNRRGGNFSADHMIELPGEKSSAVAAEDLDQDGWVDLIVANAYRLKSREGDIYNIIETNALNSYIYWGGEDGFLSEKRTELPTVSPQDISTGDLNHDGWSDIFFAQSTGGASFLYYGGPDGFLPNRRKAIPGYSDGSSEVADLNSDGWSDLIVAPSASADASQNMAKIYWGNSYGLKFADPHLIPVGNTGGIIVAELNKRSAKKDLVVLNRSDGPPANFSPGYLYKGGPNGFSTEARIEIPTELDDSYLGADFNADGYVDLFDPQTSPTIFWGGQGDFSTENTTKISDQFAVSGRAADLNRDGYLDLVLSEWSRGGEFTHIYYGSPSGFSSSYTQKLPIRSVRFHTLADLNNDGWIDILFPDFIGEKVVIFWNSPLGFEPDNKTILPVRSAVSVEVADLNADGFLDVIVPNLFDEHPSSDKKRAFGGSPEADTFIFWGGPDGPNAENPTILPTIGAEDVGIADLDLDGDLDMVVTSYHAGTTRSHPSYIFWNDKGLFAPENLTLLPTNSASGTLVADYNRDGWPDIFFSNHSKNGNHMTDSWLYYGGPKGFSEKRRANIPSIGNHMLTVVDIGNIFDRSDHFSYISSIHKTPKIVDVESLSWDAETLFGTEVRFQIRAASNKEDLKTSNWVGPSGKDSFFTKSGERVGNNSISGDWFQIKAELISPNGANSPIIRSISLDY